MTRRVLLGKFPDGNYGLRVSQSGVDVMTLSPNTNPGDNELLVFNSDWLASLPVIASGSVTLNNGNSTTISYPALGYTPFGNIIINTSNQATGNFEVYNNDVQNIFTWGAHLEGGLQIKCALTSAGLNISNNHGDTCIIGYTIYRLRAF